MEIRGWTFEAFRQEPAFRASIAWLFLYWCGSMAIWLVGGSGTLARARPKYFACKTRPGPLRLSLWRPRA
jgi:hypothetical protein